MTDVVYLLRDRDPELVAAWRERFAGVERVRPAAADIFADPADAVVSPANCFGFMDGGIDAAYTRRLGPGLPAPLRAVIGRDRDGEQPVGLAVAVDTGDPGVPVLVAAPTLRAPVSVAGTLNASLAFRAVLRAVRRLNADRPGAVARVACPGLGTGTGELPAAVCAKQMRAAWDEVEGGQPFRPAGVNDALIQHYRLLRAD